MDGLSIRNIYVSVNCDITILNEFVKDMGISWSCSQPSSNLNFMNFYLYLAVSILTAIFAHFLIGSLKSILLRSFFFPFFVSCLRL